MEKCKDCSSNTKSIYHVDKCPNPKINFIPIDNDYFNLDNHINRVMERRYGKKKDQNDEETK